jgi:hypothetical protein
MQIFTNEVLLNILEKPSEFGEGIYTKINTAEEIIAVYEAVKTATIITQRQYHFETTNYEKTIEELKSYFKIIKAAGGIVLKKNKVLFIKRLGKWDLPKGKIDKGEEQEVAAIREVLEECGVTTHITNQIGTTWHTYMQGEKNILKKTVWYEMKCIDDTHLSPQIAENITEIRWVKLYKADKVLVNSYNSIRSIYQHFLMKKIKALLDKEKKKKPLIIA